MAQSGPRQKERLRILTFFNRLRIVFHRLFCASMELVGSEARIAHHAFEFRPCICVSCGGVGQ